MRSIPQGHALQWLILCHNCDTYYYRETCSTGTLYGYHLSEQQFESSYNKRIYWTDGNVHEVTMYLCPGCKNWMRDPNDDDPETPHMYNVVPWACECGAIYPGKDEADECCS